jgi:phospholipid N-methyltransferase
VSTHTDKTADVFKTDPEAQSLFALKDANNYNDWLTQQFKPFLGNRVMELGAGIGNMAKHLLDREQLLLVERDPEYLKHLRENFSSHSQIKILCEDLENPDTFERVLKHPVDSLICLNVMEHLIDDRAFLSRLRSLMTRNQNVVIAVPQHDWLYSEFDRLVEHQHRYSKNELSSRLKESGFEIEYLEDFNRIGSLGWFVRFRLFRSTSISLRSTQLFDKGVPLWKYFEPIKIIPALSLIAVARPKS